MSEGVVKIGSKGGRGKRFGFVKFREVRDAEELLSRLGDVWLGSFKLRVNLSRFNREERRRDNLDDVPETSKACEARSQPGRSFKAALVEDASKWAIKEDVDRYKVEEQKLNEVVWEVEVETEAWVKLKGAYVGSLMAHKDVYDIQQKFLMDGYQNIKVVPLGHLRVLVSSSVEGGVKEVLRPPSFLIVVLVGSYSNISVCRWVLILGCIQRGYLCWIRLREDSGLGGTNILAWGGRIVLINAVLGAILIFFLSYMRMPLKVWREVVRIQRNFLWGGLTKRRRINWVKWEDLCKPKKEGGLGIRNLRLVNLSLLTKWRWRLLSGEGEVWKDIIVAKYGERVMGNARLDNIVYLQFGSAWWRDLCNLDKDEGWFNQVVLKKVGMGNSILFWKDVWAGDQSLEHRFPRLFGISIQQNEVVRNMGSWVNVEWRWELLWRRQFFVWENELVRELGEVLNIFPLSEEVDRWVWKPNEAEGFSVKSLYDWLDSTLVTRAILTPLEAFSFCSIWKCVVPSKVSALAWQLFLDRIPTKDNLCRRRIIRSEDAVCDMCGGVSETSRHVFMHCDFAAQVWYAICRWLGVVVLLPPDVMTMYGSLVGCGSNKKIKKGFSIVWLAFIWVMWRSRNDKVFNNVAGVVEDALNHIQRISWQWFLSNTAKGPCLLYEWSWDPGKCMLR
ncbi:hypothetical protein TSUD_223660 [Trifolium subterraneum]|uniref:Reverse transcriptase zinc-binding domain-containing protein n=1 Tax=Trifolium subterraneum TaxID=3900 RepID=A0A2Z6N195_TRISU|nr:hypothetical protein TSUD_223660 [Trifolium subterraneum]